MSLLSVISTTVLESYKLSQPEDGARFTPRPGYYLILSVFQQEKNGLSFPKAKALYRKSADEQFISGAEVEIQLLSLFEKSAKGPKDLNKEDLVGKVIVVLRCFPGYCYLDNKKHSLVLSEWVIEQNPQKLVSDSDFEIGAIMGDGNLLEAWNRFEASVSEDILTAIYDSYEDEYQMAFAMSECEDVVDDTEYND